LYILPTGGEIGRTTTLEGLYDFFWGNVLFLMISQNLKGAWNCIDAHIFGPPAIFYGIFVGQGDAPHLLKSVKRDRSQEGNE